MLHSSATMNEILPLVIWVHVENINDKKIKIKQKNRYPGISFMKSFKKLILHKQRVEWWLQEAEVVGGGQGIVWKL